MNAIQFFRLIRTIYRGHPPDLAFIQRLGLLAVKIGQIYALRPDFLEEDQCRELAKLYRQVAHIPTENAKELLKIAAPSALQEAIQFFDPIPRASASVGQVHHAILKTGEEVAIKLVKQQFTAGFRQDVQRLQRLFRVVIGLYPRLGGMANPLSLLAQIEKMTLSELDLRHEVAGQQELQAIYLRYRDQFDLSHLHFAQIYPAFSGERILVSEFLHLKTMDELIEKRTFTYDRLLEFFHIQGFYTFYIGTFHGDIHPGNIFVDETGFFFVDTGYIGRVSDKLRKNLFRFFDALSHYDYGACAHFLNKMADQEIEGSAYQRYEKAFFDLYREFKGKNVSQISFTRQMMQTIRLGVLSGMNFSEGIFDIIKNMMYLDGMVLRTNPAAVLLEDMRPFLNKYRSLIGTQD